MDTGTSRGTGHQAQSLGCKLGQHNKGLENASRAATWQTAYHFPSLPGSVSAPQLALSFPAGHRDSDILNWTCPFLFVGCQTAQRRLSFAFSLVTR